MTAPDMINHPPHYIGRLPDGGTLEVIDVIESYRLGYHLGSAVAYILRAGRKFDDPLEDLRKAVWYLERQARIDRNYTHSLARDADAPAPSDVSAAFGLSLYVSQALGLILAPMPCSVDCTTAAHHLRRELEELEDFLLHSGDEATSDEDAAMLEGV